MRAQWVRLAGTALLMVAGARLEADVRMPALFGDAMVVQSDAPIKVWGWADPGEQVTVIFGGQTNTAVAGADGCWRVTLDPVSAGGPYEMAVAGRNAIVIKGILAGEVWVCSGQSNMYWPVGRSGDARAECAAADWPRLRLFTVEQDASDAPRADCRGRWAACAPETVSNFSATAYYFGRELHRTLGVPVGLIHSSWRGTDIQSWTSREGLEPYPDLLGRAARTRAIDLERHPARMKRYEGERAAWTAAVAAAQAAGIRPPPSPKPPADPAAAPGAHRLFNAMIAPLIPFGIRGVLWYQGEKNVPEAYAYRTLFPAMIADWRRRWGQGDFPFLYAQIGGWVREAPAEPADNPFAELREAQFLALAAVSNTAMAVMLDIGQNDVHFPNKQEAGRRLALAGLATVYGQTNRVYSGPMVEAVTLLDDRVRVRFRHAGGGLVLKEPAARCFAVAGEDRAFVWADARIEDNALVVRSPAVARPVAVRYAWNERTPLALYNAEGLPAPPFRTDDWPGATWPKP